MVKEKRWWLHCVLATILVMSGAIFVYHVLRGFRPPSNNHLILVNNGNQRYLGPLTVKFTGDDTGSWNKTIWGIGEQQHSCVIINVEEAFFPGQLEVIDGAGKSIRKCELRPPGRINKTAVIFLPDDYCFPLGRAKFGYLPLEIKPASVSKNPPSQNKSTNGVRGEFREFRGHVPNSQ